MEKLIYKVHGDFIEFINYPFKCSSVYKTKTLKSIDIVDVSDKSYGPAPIRTTNSELIFAPFQEDGEHKKLSSFYASNNIPLRKITDVWEIINDPFLDTVHSDDFIERGYTQLENCGISRMECNAIRLEVAGRMLAYNSILWDWCHLGLYDVLYASLGFLSGEKHRLSDVDFERFYWRAMSIALKGFGHSNPAV